MDPERNNKQTPGPGGEDKRPKPNVWVALTIAIVVVLLISALYNRISNSQYTPATWTDFRTAMAENNLSEVQIQSDRIIYLTKEEAAQDPAQQQACVTGLPTTMNPPLM